MAEVRTCGRGTYHGKCPHPAVAKVTWVRSRRSRKTGKTIAVVTPLYVCEQHLPKPGAVGPKPLVEFL